MNLNKRHLFQRGNELFAYLQVYGSKLPPEDETTIEVEFNKLKNIVKLAVDYVKTEDARRFLVFCAEELDNACGAYQKQEDDVGLKFMDAAKHLFDEANKDKPSRATFIVGPDGTAEKV